MRYAASLIGSFCIVMSFAAEADTPARRPETFRICNQSVTSCAELDPASDAVVYRISAKFNAKEAYRIPGWHRSAFLSRDGVYFASGYGGGNLLARDAAVNSTVVLRIWKNGRPHMTVTLGQVLRSLSSLKPTVSHFVWGTNLGFQYDGRFESFEIETVEGKRAIVDPAAQTVKIDG